MRSTSPTKTKSPRSWSAVAALMTSVVSKSSCLSGGMAAFRCRMDLKAKSNLETSNSRLKVYSEYTTCELTVLQSGSPSASGSSKGYERSGGDFRLEASFLRDNVVTSLALRFSRRLASFASLSAPDSTPSSDSGSSESSAPVSPFGNAPAATYSASRWARSRLCPPFCLFVMSYPGTCYDAGAKAEDPIGLNLADQWIGTKCGRTLFSVATS
ncbi:unnamed protein product [Somion occarium]|uniref:Secreted protein n=1 Tax=Somion occarium TaxID=3059160 RepID=A0ABP1E3C7_9APHY